MTIGDMKEWRNLSRKSFRSEIMMEPRRLMSLVGSFCIILILTFLTVCSEAAPVSPEIKTLNIGCGEPLNVLLFFDTVCFNNL